MAIVTRTYLRTGPSAAELARRVGMSSAFNASGLTNAIDVDISNVATNFAELLNEFMQNEFGAPFNAALVAADVAAHAARQNGAGADPVPDATGAVAGLLSAADFTKLAGILAGAGSMVMPWGNANIGASADTRFMTPGFQLDTLARSGADVQTPVPRAGTVKNLRVYHNTAVGNANTAAYTVLKNGVATTLTVSLAANSTGPASDTTHSFAVVAGDRLSIQVVKAAGIVSGALNVCGSVEIVG